MVDKTDMISCLDKEDFHKIETEMKPQKEEKKLNILEKKEDQTLDSL
jgi:hypothetical protein